MVENLTRSARIKSIIAASSGNLVEWFDFYVYAFTISYFAHHFSVSDSDLVQQIQAFGIFALGFFMRPIGSWIFGSIADKVGRKSSMVSSIVLMATGSIIIAILPTKDVLGPYAALMLLFARLLQGLSVGGEYGIVAAYMSELAEEGRRGFYSSFQYVTLIGGQFLAVGSISLMLLFFTDEEMRDYAWRILFLIGGLLALGSLFIRKAMYESADKLYEYRQRGSFCELLKNYRAFLFCMFITAGGSLAFYTITTYSKTYLAAAGLLSKQTSTNVIFAALAFLMLAQPFFGLLSDKIGHKTSLIIFATLALLGIYPLFILLDHAQTPAMAFFVMLALFAILSFYTSTAGIFKAKLFPVQVRALGTGFGYALPNAIFGGSAPFVALQFKKAGIENGFFVYVAIILTITLIAALLIPRRGELN